MMTEQNANKPQLFGLVACKRTSLCGSRPCDEAEEVPFVYVDRRTVDDPMKNPYIGAKWYDEGRNHRVENGMIARDLESTRWMVRIADAEALQSFCLKYGPIVISVNNDGLHPCFELEIYDDFRE